MQLDEPFPGSQFNAVTDMKLRPVIAKESVKARTKHLLNVSAMPVNIIAVDHFPAST
jgi:hypothetical protein